MKLEHLLNGALVMLGLWAFSVVLMGLAKFDGWLQRVRGVAEVNGRRPDGPVAIFAIVLVGAAFLALILYGGGGGGHIVDGCSGSMRC